MRIAVAGSPNVGKSTLFNALTGADAQVGNYAGVTVTRRTASLALPSGAAAELLDLPGCTSLTPRAAEEEVAHAALMGHVDVPRPDVVICAVDATQLARGLYLAVQLLEHGLPTVVAVTMVDVARRRGEATDVVGLARQLGVAVVAVDAAAGEGLEALLAAAVRATPPPPALAAAVVAALPAGDREAVAALAAALPPSERAPGACLWLLTAELARLRVRLPAAVAAAAGAAQAALPDAAGLRGRAIAARYQIIDALLASAPTAAVGAPPDEGRTAALDRVLLHPIAGPLALVLTLGAMLQAVFWGAAPLVAGVEAATQLLATFARATVPAGHFQSLVCHGIIGGIGTVLAFVPQISLLFAAIALLEQSGYMARAAFLLDHVMRRAGLHGRAVVPLLGSLGCAIPGIMAARTIEARRDRLVTILVAPFISCSARLPVFTLVVAALFGEMPPVLGFLSVGGLVVAAMYGLGFAAALGTAWLLKRTALRAPTPPLVLELPLYRLPAPRALGRQVARQAGSFLRESGPTIVLLSVVFWALVSFPAAPLPPAAATAARATAVAAGDDPEAAIARAARAHTLAHSAAGRLGHTIAPAIAPLGFDWRIGVGLLSAFAAREVFVSALGQLYAVDADVPTLGAALRAERAAGGPGLTPLAGLSLLVFFVLALQCSSTVAAVWRETGSWRWPAAQLAYMNALAYLASLAVYQGGTALGLGLGRG